jgi:hypothetical protein
MNVLMRFNVAILAGLEALLAVFGHPDWAMALWLAVSATTQSSRTVTGDPVR